MSAPVASVPSTAAWPKALAGCLRAAERLVSWELWVLCPFGSSPQPDNPKGGSLWTPRKPEAAARPEEAPGSLASASLSQLSTSHILVSIPFDFLHWMTRYLVDRAQAGLGSVPPFLWPLADV